MRKKFVVLLLFFMALFFMRCNSPSGEGGITKEQLEQPPTEETHGPVR